MSAQSLSPMQSQCSSVIQLSDHALVARAQKELPGPSVAFTCLLSRHQQTLVGVCRRLLNQHPDYEDVVQEVMLRAMAALPDFEGRSSFRTWILSIAKNTCHTARERRNRRQLAVISIQSELAAQSQSSLFSGAADSVDVGRMLASLPPPERKLLALRYLMGLSFEEVAEATGMKLSAAKMRIYRALRKVRTEPHPAGFPQGNALGGFK